MINVIYYDAVFADDMVAHNIAKRTIEIWKKENKYYKSAYSCKNDVTYKITYEIKCVYDIGLEREEECYKSIDAETLFNKTVSKYRKKDYVLVVNRLQSVGNNARRAFEKLISMMPNYKDIFIVDISLSEPLRLYKDKFIEYFRIDEKEIRKRIPSRSDDVYFEMMKFIRNGEIIKKTYPDGTTSKIFRPRKMREAEEKFGILRSVLDKFCKRKYGVPFAKVKNSEFGCNAPDVKIYNYSDEEDN